MLKTGGMNLKGIVFKIKINMMITMLTKNTMSVMTIMRVMVLIATLRVTIIFIAIMNIVNEHSDYHCGKEDDNKDGVIKD